MSNDRWQRHPYQPPAIHDSANNVRRHGPQIVLTVQGVEHVIDAAALACILRTGAAVELADRLAETCNHTGGWQ